MVNTCLNGDNTVFVVLSFEGPDIYSLAGGLGVRIANLTSTLAVRGFPVHLFFIGDPKKDGCELIDRRLYLHRWCQWISNFYPRGVYEAEWEKINDYNASIPDYVVKNIAGPAIEQGKIVVVLGEEWHTAKVMSLLSDRLFFAGLRNNVLMFWNANNTFGFDRINWPRLSFTSRLTTVSRYMKRIMRDMGLDPLVIPNGIPETALEPVNSKITGALKAGLNADTILTKVARFDPDKSWESAIETIARLKRSGNRASLIARGGIEPYGASLLSAARGEGLTVTDVYTEPDTTGGYIDAIGQAAGSDIINLKFHCPQNLLRVIYNASDAVLANSRHEPFGLVGLETMAAGGVAFTGGTGEDYATSNFNSIVLDTTDSREIEESLLYLSEHPAEAEKIRRNAKDTAKYFTWEKVIGFLVRRLELQAYQQGLIDLPKSFEQIELPSVEKTLEAVLV
jgi:glycosyltransferase involved in cell wall biosynthesis